MKNVQGRARTLALSFTLGALAPAATAFEAIDTLPWPSEGTFPAYPREADRPTDFWVHAGIRRDDNVLRRETGEQSDTIVRFGAGIRHEQRVFGRQRVRLEARGDYYKYGDLSELDHFGYAARGDWLWEVGNRLSGTVSAGAVRRQVDLAESGSLGRDLATELRAALTAAYLLTPRIRVRGGVAATRADRPELEEAAVRAASLTFGADYVSQLGNTIGFEYRTTNGEARGLEDIAGVAVSNDYRENELAAVVTYALGTQLRSGLRLGYTSREYDEFPARDFDGATGRVFLDWLPGNKTILGFEAYYEPRSVVDLDASHVVLKGFAFGPRWAATNKVVLSARFVRERREYEGDPALVVTGGPLRSDLVQLVRLAAGWEPQRFWQVSVAVDRGERESNFAGRDYQFTGVMGNVAYVW